MSNKPLCRIGVFYEGAYISYAQHHFHADRQLGWLAPRLLHNLIEEFIRENEPNYSHHRIVYAGWYKAWSQSNFDSSDKDLLSAGIEPKYIPTSSSKKGVHIAMAIDALELGLGDKIEIAVLVTGDGDFVPLARALLKNSIRMATVCFEYESAVHTATTSEHLLNMSTYALNISALENDPVTQSRFRNLFRGPDMRETVAE